MNYITLCLVSIVLMGFNMFVVKVLTSHMKPITLMLLKFGIGSIVLISYTAYSRTEIAINRNWLYAAIVGVWWAFAMTFTYTAIAEGPVSIVMPLYNLWLVIPVILGFVVLHEPVTLTKILGIFFAVAAIILLTR